MVAIKDKLRFNYNGKSSEDFGLVAISLDSGMYEEVLVPSISVNETRPVNRDIPILHGVTREKRSFPLILAFEKDFNSDLIGGIIDWLFKDSYKPLYFEDGLDRIMFSMITGESSLTHNGLKQGYFTVNVETNSAYRYSRKIERKIGVEKSYRVNNRGHKETYPKYLIEKIGAGDLKLSVNGKNVLITNLEDKEVLKIDSLRETIETDIPGAYRYNNIKVGELEDLYFKKGLSDIIITGEADITTEHREIYMF